MVSSIKLSTTNSFDGYKITNYLGIVSESVVVGTNLFSDFFASVSDIFGGKSRSYQKQLYKLREFALEGLAVKAKEKGANAILGILIDSDEISGQGKSMFMINVTGTAVVIQKIDNNRVETQVSIITRDEIRKHLKLLEIEKRYIGNAFRLKEDEIELLIHGEIPDVAKYFIKSFHTYINSGITQAPYYNPSPSSSENDFDITITSLIEYLSQFDTQEQISFFYPLIPEYVKLGLDELLMTVLIKLHLVDYNKISEWFNIDSVQLNRFALKVLKIIKAGYSMNDVVACRNLISKIENKYPINYLEDGSQKWECKCGKINDIEHSICRRCKRDRMGFLPEETKPAEVIKILQGVVSVAEKLLLQK